MKKFFTISAIALSLGVQTLFAQTTVNENFTGVNDQPINDTGTGTIINGVTFHGHTAKTVNDIQGSPGATYQTQVKNNAISLWCEDDSRNPVTWNSEVPDKTVTDVTIDLTADSNLYNFSAKISRPSDGFWWYRVQYSADNGTSWTLLKGIDEAIQGASVDINETLPSVATGVDKVRINIWRNGGNDPEEILIDDIRVNMVTVNSLTAISQSGFTANWNAISSADSYTINLYSDEALTTQVGSPVTGITGTSQAVSQALTSKVPLYYTVSAIKNSTVVAKSVAQKVLYVNLTLKHRYSFTADASDSVGDADLTLTGNATVSGNKLTLTGGKADAAGDALTELATTIKVSTPITIEAWYTITPFKVWSKLYTIGSGTTDHLLLTPRTGDAAANNACRPAIFTANGSKLIDDSVATVAGTQVYISVTYDPVLDQMTFHRAFAGGSVVTQVSDMAGAKLSDLTINAFSLAAANWWPDPNMEGSIDEFRIWEGKLDNATASSHFTAGPDDDIVTPAIGLDVEQIGDELTWTVEDEINVEKYVITYTVNGKTKTETVFYKEANNGSYTLALEEGAIVVDFETVDNSGYAESYPVENGNITSKRYNLEEGWNLIAIISDDANLETLKDETVGVLWGWNGASYEVIETAKATDAIWVYSPIEKQVHVSGTKSDAKIKLNLGWNMVGPVENDYIPEGADTVYSWSEVYDIIAGEEKVLIGGKGYWIFSL